MALTFSITKRLGPRKGAGGVRTNIVRVTFDNAYTDGGYAITAANLGFNNQVLMMNPLGIIHDATTTSAETGYITSYDQVLGKLQVFHSGGGAASDPPGEVADNVAGINGLVCDFLCMGL